MPRSPFGSGLGAKLGFKVEALPDGLVSGGTSLPPAHHGVNHFKTVAVPVSDDSPDHARHSADDWGQPFGPNGLPDQAISVVFDVAQAHWDDAKHPLAKFFPTPDDPVSPDFSFDGGGAKPSWGGGGGKNKGGTTTTDSGTSTGTTTGTTSGTTTTTTTTSPYVGDYKSGKDTPDGYNIDLKFAGSGWTDVIKQYVIDAAEHLSDVIRGDLPGFTSSMGTIDDILVTVTLTTIDGSGGFAGWGGTTASRSGSYLPGQGYMKLDSADTSSLVSKGILDDMILHEMLHSLGFGVSWKSMGLVSDVSGDLRFNGDYATKMYGELYPTLSANDPLADIGVPIETDGGSGTAGVHWDDATFKNELMTGALNLSNKLSDLSVAALQDMGYDTYVSDHIFIA